MGSVDTGTSGTVSFIVTGVHNVDLSVNATTTEVGRGSDPTPMEVWRKWPEARGGSTHAARVLHARCRTRRPGAETQEFESASAETGVLAFSPSRRITKAEGADCSCSWQRDAGREEKRSMTLGFDGGDGRHDRERDGRGVDATGRQNSA